LHAAINTKQKWRPKMKTSTIFFVTFLIIAVIVMNGCAPSSTPIATIEIPSPTLALPTETVVLPTPTPQGRTLQVTSTEDRGPGTLRQALLDAQPYDTIAFDPAVFPTNAPATIAVTNELPHIRISNLTLDASQAGVILDGSQVQGEWVAGLQIVSSEANTIWGLQVSNFSGPGIAVSGDSKYNVIGGDRSLGTGPFGQGNMFSRNVIGIDLATNGATVNTITGNLIGTDAAGPDGLGNLRSGIYISEGAHGNIIGPDNVIANNGEFGVEVYFSDTLHNTITQNSIHDNSGKGIDLKGGGNTELVTPIIFEVNLPAGAVNGAACPNCSVEIFSDNDNEGAVYEGQAVADSSGNFAFSKGSVFINTSITLTATDADGNTSEFSRPAGRTTRIIMLQEGNSLPGFQLLPRPSNQLVADTRLGASLYSSNIWNDIPHLDRILHNYLDFGAKRLDTSMQEVEEPIDWNRSEYEIFVEYDRFVDDLNENGVVVNYMLHFWDKDGRASGEELSTPRFKTEEQIQDFLEYVRFVVSHFKGRVQYYTLWSEPDNCGGSRVKCIEPLDYIELARKTIPVIRQEDPQAKVALAPNVLFFDRDYLFSILTSDVIPMFDVIQWHGIYDVTPDNVFFGNYYYEYPTIIEDIKQTATANGFNGEFWGTELTWCSEEYPTCHPPDQPWGILKTDKLAAKYYARGIIIQIGMDVGVSFGGLEGTDAPWTYPTIRNLNTVMAGTTPLTLAVDIESEATDIMSYAFSLATGDMLLALWTNGVAVDDDPGVKTTITFPGLSAQEVIGIDVLNGFEQELITETENGNLVIRNLLVKDYPIILRLID
jgi:hypothetical protein